MRIAYFITARGHGRGGHFHSLNHISSAIGARNNVKIYVLGPGKSEIIESNSHFQDHIYFNGRNLFEFQRKLKRSIEVFRPEIIHCFDLTSYNLISLFCPKSKSKIILNKCGGPNPNRYPIVDNLVLFSQENYSWFKNNKKFMSSNIHLISNRINRTELDIKPQYKNLVEKKDDEFSFVVIARIGEYYKDNLFKSISLIRQLSAKSLMKIRLYIVGTVESADTYKYLREEGKDIAVTFLTEDIYTVKASNMLYLADAIIGTGRGLMEGMGHGKPVLTPASNSKLPIMVNAKNFDNFFRTNFSPRNKASESDILYNNNYILDIINNKDKYTQTCLFSEKMFKEFFDVESGIEKYMNAYKALENNIAVNTPNLLNLLYQIRTLYSFIKI